MNQTKKVRTSIKYIFLSIALILGNIFVPHTTALAASAAVNLSLSTENVEVDSTFSVVLTVQASEEIGNLQCYLSFDSDVLKFVSGGANVTGGNGVVMISDKDSTDESTTKKYSMKFKAIKAGESTLWIEENASITCLLDDTTMSVSCNQLLFQITDPESVSDDTTLAKLLVSSGKLSPDFSKDRKKYKMEVEPTINQISVNAVPTDGNATVSISGNTKLQTGNNTVKITVTAPSGDKAVTKIVVTKKESKVTQEETLSEKTSDTIQNAGVTASEDEAGNRFLSEELRLQIIPLEDESLLPENYEKTTIVLDGLPITVYNWKYDLNSDNLLLYGMNQDGDTGLYQYNRANNTLTKYSQVKDAAETKESTTSAELENTVSPETSYMIIICLLAGACIVLTILLVLHKMKVSNIHSNSNEKEDDFF